MVVSLDMDCAGFGAIALQGAGAGYAERRHVSEQIDSNSWVKRLLALKKDWRVANPIVPKLQEDLLQNVCQLTHPKLATFYRSPGQCSRIGIPEP